MKKFKNLWKILEEWIFYIAVTIMTYWVFTDSDKIVTDFIIKNIDKDVF